MLRNSDRNVKLRSILIVIILATLPCYLLGMIVLWIGNTIKNQPTVTPTLAITITVSPWEGTPTNTLPPIPTSPEFPTLTPTITETPTLTATFFIPSNTPTLSPTPTETPTETVTPTPDLTLTTAPVTTSETP